ncbi:MAG: NAD(P)-dependent oxidoreductase [Bacillota bacterium]|nr:NAD(P)-dependent oxidoreductase [Bacillota bacterium]MDW7684821.1 NAD(P)-dependent oxidoreductase [Bacillota bacterium]
MKILITGATGFVGGFVISEMLQYGHDIVATSRNSNRAKSKDWFSKVCYIHADLNQENPNYFAYFGKPDLLIHLAWEGLPDYHGLFHIEKNLWTQCKFIKNMVHNGLKSLTIVGTCLEYGMQNGCLTEDMDTKPSTPYGLAKNFLQQYVAELHKNYEFHYKWLRLFYIYGPGQNEHSIFAQLERAVINYCEEFNMTAGEQLRDYLPIEKAAEYIVKISLKKQVSGIFNCCSGQPVSLRKFIEGYLDKKEYKIKLNLGYYPYPDYEPLAFWGDNSKLKITLNLN